MLSTSRRPRLQPEPFPSKSTEARRCCLSLRAPCAADTKPQCSLAYEARLACRTHALHRWGRRRSPTYSTPSPSASPSPSPARSLQRHSSPRIRPPSFGGRIWICPGGGAVGGDGEVLAPFQTRARLLSLVSVDTYTPKTKRHGNTARKHGTETWHGNTAWHGSTHTQYRKNRRGGGSRKSLCCSLPIDRDYAMDLYAYPADRLLHGGRGDPPPLETPAPPCSFINTETGRCPRTRPYKQHHQPNLRQNTLHYLAVSGGGLCSRIHPLCYACPPVTSCRVGVV